MALISPNPPAPDSRLYPQGKNIAHSL